MNKLVISFVLISATAFAEPPRDTSTAAQPECGKLVQLELIEFVKPKTEEIGDAQIIPLRPSNSHRAAPFQISQNATRVGWLKATKTYGHYFLHRYEKDLHSTEEVKPVTTDVTNFIATKKDLQLDGEGFHADMKLVKLGGRDFLFSFHLPKATDVEMAHKSSAAYRLNGFLYSSVGEIKQRDISNRFEWGRKLDMDPTKTVRTFAASDLMPHSNNFFVYYGINVPTFSGKATEIYLRKGQLFPNQITLKESEQTLLPVMRLENNLTIPQIYEPNRGRSVHLEKGSNGKVYAVISEIDLTQFAGESRIENNVKVGTDGKILVANLQIAGQTVDSVKVLKDKATGQQNLLVMARFRNSPTPVYSLLETEIISGQVKTISSLNATNFDKLISKSEIVDSMDLQGSGGRNVVKNIKTIELTGALADSIESLRVLKVKSFNQLRGLVATSMQDSQGKKIFYEFEITDRFGDVRARQIDAREAGYNLETATATHETLVSDNN